MTKPNKPYDTTPRLDPSILGLYPSPTTNLEKRGENSKLHLVDEEKEGGKESTNQEGIEEVDTTAGEAKSRLEWKRSKEGREVIITSMDVIALYPNLRIERCAEEVGREVEETEVEYENVDYRLGGEVYCVEYDPSRCR